MITLSAQDLSNYGALESPSTLTFLGKVFVRGQSFSLAMREQATTMAEKSLQKGRPCMLVESDTEITLWVEMQNQTPPLQPASTNTPEVITLEPESKELERSASLTYRGQVITPPPQTSPFSNKSLDVSAANTASEPDTTTSRQSFTLSYRGQTFEIPAAHSEIDSSLTLNSPESSDSFENLANEESHSLSTPKQASSLKQKMQYRGQWID